MFTSKMPLLWVLNHILLALQICTIRYLEKNQRPKTQILSSGFVILRKKGSMCLRSAPSVSTQAILISRQAPSRAASVRMQTRELCLEKSPSHCRPQMCVCQEELRLPFPVSNKFSWNWTTGYTSLFCTLWQLRFRAVLKKNTEFWEESNTVSFTLPKPGLADPSRGLARTSLGPPGLWGGCWHPSDSPGLCASPAALQDILPCWVSQPKFLFLETPQLEHRALSKTPNPPAPDTASPLESKDCFFSSSHLFLTLSGLLSKEKLLPPKPQSFTSPGVLSPNLHTSTLWLPLRKLHLFKGLSPC